MEDELIEKISRLEGVLKARGNMAYEFFEKLRTNLQANRTQETVDDILRSYAMTQYADFKIQEEQLFDEIWHDADNIKKKSNN